jgi:hypothetical protein
MLFDPPAMPCAWALSQLGMDTAALVIVHGREGLRGAAVRHLLTSADVLWALEQALRSGHVGAVVAWLPDGIRADAVRRLQLAAQVHDGPVFLMRGIETRLRPSPAALRLSLHAAGPDAIDVQLLKRRGPPLTRMLRLSLPAPAGLRRSLSFNTSARELTPGLSALSVWVSAHVSVYPGFEMLWIGIHLPQLPLEAFAATLGLTQRGQPMALLKGTRLTAVDSAAAALVW